MRSIFKQKQNTSGVKVFVGLSGGVDSAVSAALLQEQGYEVTGVFIRIVVPGYPCTAGQDRIDAMRVAAHLKIPFLEVDFSDEYVKEVFRPSLAEFERGETPNPDVLCNRAIKFGSFFEYANARGADLIATGHYARSVEGKLYTGVDDEKDQSYFLWAVPPVVLAHTLFPIGDMKKEAVRAYAQKIGLPNSARPDSQGLCFLGPISLNEMLQKELTLTPGTVLSEEGVVVGEHEGAARYTLGQRHGFRLLSQSSTASPYYVVGKDVVHNTITVSTARMPRGSRKTELTLTEENWIGEIAEGPCEARFRYRQKLIPALLREGGVTLQEPHYVPLGQSLVVYRGERCLGGGIIKTATLR
jgi:tRNA-specific 2-thiouridylase